MEESHILTYGSQGGWVELDGERYDIRARIHSVGGYSAHAGQGDLLTFVDGIPRSPKEIRIVHGDAGAKEALRVELQIMAPESKVLIPAG